MTRELSRLQPSQVFEWERSRLAEIEAAQHHQQLTDEVAGVLRRWVFESVTDYYECLSLGLVGKGE